MIEDGDCGAIGGKRIGRGSSSFVNTIIVFLNIIHGRVLNKNGKMDNVQKHNNCLNIHRHNLVNLSFVKGEKSQEHYTELIINSKGGSRKSVQNFGKKTTEKQLPGRRIMKGLKH
jgi:hypothetical protein